MCGMAALVNQNRAYTLVFITRSNCSVVMPAIPSSCDIWNAALLTSTSIRPNSRTAVSTTC